MFRRREIYLLKETLRGLKREGKVWIALLFGSYAQGRPHSRSDIDLAVFIKARDKKEEIDIIDAILMATETPVSLLRLDDEEESPFVVQEALKGIHLVPPDIETLYSVSRRVLHETEGIRFLRRLSA